VPANSRVFPTNSGFVMEPVSTTPSDRVTLTSICWIKFSPFPPLNVVMIRGLIDSPLLFTSTSIFQFSGRVWVGPGVRETGVDDAVGVAAVVVAEGVGVDVDGGVAG